MSKTDGLYWECRECKRTLPRHPSTKLEELGWCPRCGSTNWKGKQETADG